MGLMVFEIAHPFLYCLLWENRVARPRYPSYPYTRTQYVKRKIHIPDVEFLRFN